MGIGIHFSKLPSRPGFSPGDVEFLRDFVEHGTYVCLRSAAR